MKIFLTFSFLVFLLPSFAQNGAPTATLDIALAIEDTPTPIFLLDNDTDPDGDPLTMTILLGPFNGTITDIFGFQLYTGNQDFNGIDFLMYEACDPDSACSTTFAFIYVAPVNDAPVALNDNVTTDEEVSVDITVQDNDSDVDGDALVSEITEDPLHGIAIVIADNTITYTPDLNFNGVDVFDYQICDTAGACDNATVNVTVNPVNDPPTAIDDSTTADYENGATVLVLINDFDIDGDSIHLQFVDEPNSGTVSSVTSTSFFYTPQQGVLGTDSFAYKVCDNINPSLCDTGWVFISPEFNFGTDLNVIIPDGFSPNGDGINDKFVIVNVSEYPENEFIIYNRWGNQVYEMTGYDNSWTGDSYKGEHLPDGYYFWIFDPAPQRKSVSGWLALKR